MTGERWPLTPRERERYERQIPLLGEEGQERLLHSSVCIAGAGGLGSPVAFYLAAAGIGRIRIIDSDRVSRSNLNRQIIHAEADIGRSKVDSAARRLEALNPDIEVDPRPLHLTEENVVNVVRGMNLVVDALDNYPARYILNRAACMHTVPLVHAAVNGYCGQVMAIIPRKTACLQCAIPHPPEETPPPVLGTTAGILGCIQANEAIRILLGEGTVMGDALHVWDGRAGTWDMIPVKRDPACRACGAGGKG
ncbi:MAG: HesA/MoeB/ThiF family protein [Methanolinea sp.]|nr:HesA/MoeB/ThiF family protein [Methanolinea sp.]